MIPGPPTEGSHQPRERAIPCRTCRRPTWRYHGVCDVCGPETCERCDPKEEDPGD